MGKRKFDAGKPAEKRLDMSNNHKTTPLYSLHRALDAKMVPFAGYQMPVHYKAGILQEHNHTRKKAGLFDVSHMGQIVLHGHEAGLELEKLSPINAIGLRAGYQRYGFFTNDKGGILDDFMVANRGDHLFIVVNAACKQNDIKLLSENLSSKVEPVLQRALLALQGPLSECVLSQIMPDIASMRFMESRIFETPYGPLWISRSGYTGEDGFEISVLNEMAEKLAKALLENEDVLPIGLGARDSLRLEAGLCLYGQDIDEKNSPVEAALSWAIHKVRRTGGERQGGFPGAKRILREIDEGVEKVRVGLRPQGRAPMRAGVQLYENIDGQNPVGQNPVGTVTSGVFGPTVQAPVSMGYVAQKLSGNGTVLYGDMRERRLPVEVHSLPFLPANFKR